MGHRGDVIVRLDKRVTDLGVFTAIWGLRVPWAHPVWSEYAIMFYDLKERAGCANATIFKQGMTHEFILYALDPAKPLDFTKDLYEQPLAMLQPGNMGYQFRAESDEAAIARIAECVDLMDRGSLSPDTDYRYLWDKRFEDGFALVTNVFNEMAHAAAAPKH